MSLSSFNMVLPDNLPVLSKMFLFECFKALLKILRLSAHLVDFLPVFRLQIARDRLVFLSFLARWRLFMYGRVALVTVSMVFAMTTVSMVTGPPEFLCVKTVVFRGRKDPQIRRNSCLFCGFC